MRQSSCFEVVSGLKGCIVASVFFLAGVAFEPWGGGGRLVGVYVPGGSLGFFHCFQVVCQRCLA